MKTTLAAGTILACACVQARGQEVGALWKNNCTQCHGAEGRGGPQGTGTLLDEEYKHGGSDRDLFETIKSGRPESGMEAFGPVMDDAKIWAMVVYVKELQAQARRARGESPKAEGGVYTSQHHRFRLETVIEKGLEVPWAVDFLPDGRMLVTERPGRLRIFKDSNLSAPASGVPTVRNRGQGGLMDVAVHPDYAHNGWIYLAYADPKGDGARPPGMTRIIRGKLTQNDAVVAWGDEATIFEAKAEHYLNSDIHFGCHIVFDEPNAEGRRHVFFSIGERGFMDMAQDRTRPNGKVHRLWDDGTVPEDNPFVQDADEGTYKSIWSFGHRNPQGLVFDLSGNLWDTEHGPRGGDEVNRIEKGRNYGWPIVSFGINYNGLPLRAPWPEAGSDIAMPVMHWTPSIGACGLDVVRGDAFPQWRGDLVAGGLSGQNVDRIRLAQEDGEWKVMEREELIYGQARVRDVVCGPEGAIYVVFNDPDRVVRMTPAPDR